MARSSGVLTLLVLALVTSAGAAQIETIAGGSIGDGLPATEAPVNAYGVAVAPSGDLYVSDAVNHRVRRVDAHTGIISTAVGTGAFAFCGYEGLGDEICVGQPEGLAFDRDGELLIADRLGDILRFDPESREVKHVAGRQFYDPEHCVPGSPLVNEACIAPSDVVVDSSGAIFLVTPDLRQVHRIDPTTGAIAVYAGRPITDNSVCGDGGPATEACLGFTEGIGLDADENLLIATRFDSPRIWRVDRTTGLIHTIAGRIDDPVCTDPGDGGPAAEACVAPYDVLADAGGNLLFQDVPPFGGLRRIDAGSGNISALGAGGGLHLALDGAGNLFAATGVDVTRRDALTGEVTTVAGNHTSHLCGDGLPATDACLSYPSAVAYDGAGDLFIWDLFNLRIRRVDAVTGLMSTVATGHLCQDATREPTEPCLDSLLPAHALVADTAGDLFVGTTVGTEDEGFHAIVQRLDHATGQPSLVVGLCTTSGSEGIPAREACLDHVAALAMEPDGSLLIADGARVLRVDASSGLLSLVAGSGDPGCTPGAGEGGPARDACIDGGDLALDGAGNLFIAASNRVWRVDHATRTITTVAGDGSASCQHPVADGQQATAGCLWEVYAIAASASGDLLLSSLGVIRKVDAASGTINTLAGRPTDPDGFDPCCDGCSDPPECVRALDLTIEPAGGLVIGDRDKRIVERLQPSESPSCDDGDACTIDTGDPATGCHHARLGGVAGVTCSCVRPLAPAACTGERVPPVVGRLFDRACRRAHVAETVGESRRGQHIWRRLLRDLHHAARRTGRAAQQKKLSADCAQAILQQLGVPRLSPAE